MPTANISWAEESAGLLDKRTSYANGRLAGSTTSLIDEVKIPSLRNSFDEVIRAVSINP